MVRHGLVAALAVAAMTPAGHCGVADAMTPVITGYVRVGHATVMAGDTIHGQLVLHNSSRRTVVLDRGCPSVPDSFVQLTLSNGTTTAGGAWAAPLCRPGVAFDARPGTTRYALQVRAVYYTCTMRGHPATPGSPQCVPPGNSMPLLPAGAYAVKVDAVSLHLQQELADVLPATVQIVN